MVREYSEQTSLYYARPWVDSLEEMETMWTPEQQLDYQLCADMLFIAQDLLGYPYENFSKMYGYIGFKSGGMCKYPSYPYPYLT